MGQIQFFDNKILFVAGRIAMDPACCCSDDPSCYDCISESDEFDVTIDGSIGGTYFCTDDECDVLNGTFRLARWHDRPCTWRYLFPERHPEDPWCEAGTEGIRRHFWPYSLELSWSVDDSGDVTKYHPLVRLLIQDSDIRYNWPQFTSVYKWDLPEGIDDCSNVSGIELVSQLTYDPTQEMCRLSNATARVDSVAL